jgi:hypothetical protein
MLPEPPQAPSVDTFCAKADPRDRRPAARVRYFMVGQIGAGIMRWDIGCRVCYVQQIVIMTVERMNVYVTTMERSE